MRALNLEIRDLTAERFHLGLGRYLSPMLGGGVVQHCPALVVCRLIRLAGGLHLCLHFLLLGTRLVAGNASIFHVADEATVALLRLTKFGICNHICFGAGIAIALKLAALKLEAYHLLCEGLGLPFRACGRLELCTHPLGSAAKLIAFGLHGSFARLDLGELLLEFREMLPLLNDDLDVLKLREGFVGLAALLGHLLAQLPQDPLRCGRIPE
mmetsp:Transcript_32277/g.68710  ORF Transcript_32277/g.68710 Transcript_32277/m.68710 type:complete len:212 (-) Transcript_32277:862-1497(-)